MTNIDRHQTAHEAFNRRDWDAVTNYYAPNAEYTDMARGTTAKGGAEIVDYLRDNWVQAFSDAAVTEAHYHEAGDCSISEFTGAGVQDGQMGPLPASGKRMATPFCEISRYDRDGRVVEGRLYYDQMSILSQLGHMQQPPA
jgi:steroid delta-isomerase-like uncharacterized protein